MGMSEVAPHYELVLTTVNHMDKIEVRVEVADPSIIDRYGDLEKLVNKIKHKIYTVLNIDVKVTPVAPGTLQRFEGKAKRIVDLRDKK